ncbi:hypothetical protein MJG53_002316 [Ovis ammon polii x Ovis aries]|uniref:Uncharacterized protein n=1 Tax=Ovis ammon polii x Ovis aries TaxID=2918886 RepID=A0ACB9VNF7_9CETA|nr:hypothetical protein MJG53_002316 [Ovis ammon polii x Ovis aries]
MRTASVRQAATGQTGCGVFQGPAGRALVGDGLQCGRCQWGWASAHVHVLFHLWWDEAGRHGLVKMRVWGQQCRLCPPGGAECRVSLLNVWLFLGKLVRFIAHKCYAEGPGSDQGPRSASGSAGGPAPRGFASSSSRLTPPEGPRAGAPAV